MIGADVGTWIGTSVSVLSMGIAVWQARKASNAATRAEKMRDQIASRNAHSELSNLNGILAAALRAMDKYGPGAGVNARRGNSPESDAENVRSLTKEMARLRAMLVERFGETINEVITHLNSILADFGAATKDADRVVHGRKIYIEIIEFSGNVKQVLDKNIYG